MKLIVLSYFLNAIQKFPVLQRSQGRFFYLIALLSLTVLPMLSGCRGQESRKPPIHLNPNMDFQPRYNPQSSNQFFEDGRDMRPLPEGTVAYGHLQTDSVMYFGSSGGVFAKNPYKITLEFLERGQDRYAIYCTPCHDFAGTGKGIVTTRGLVPPPNFHDPAFLKIPDGQIYQAINKGVRTMQPYGSVIPLEDRWAIVAYIRALQRSQNATLADVPEDMRSKL